MDWRSGDFDLAAGSVVALMNHGTPEMMRQKLDQVAALADTHEHLSKRFGHESGIARELREILEGDQPSLVVPVPMAECG